MKNCTRFLATVLTLFLGFVAVHGSTLTYSYDAAGRLANVNYGGNTNVDFNYDNNGNLLNSSTFVSANPNIGLAQSATPDPAVVGLYVRYNVTVFNNGATTATGVSVADTLPANTTFVSAAVNLGSFVQNSGTVTWTVGSLANQATAVMTITVRTTAAGSLTNSATASLGQTDPNPANNTTVTTTSVLAPPTLQTGVASGSLWLIWPVFNYTFSVEYTGSLKPPVSWTPLTVSPYLSSDLFYVPDLIGTNRFYRLTSPP